MPLVCLKGDHNARGMPPEGLQCPWYAFRGTTMLLRLPAGLWGPTSEDFAICRF